MATQEPTKTRVGGGDVGPARPGQGLSTRAALTGFALAVGMAGVLSVATWAPEAPGPSRPRRPPASSPVSPELRLAALAALGRALITTAPPEFELQPLPPQAAQGLNARIPFSSAPNLAAAPFFLAGEAGVQSKEKLCLTQAIYYEAGFEPVAGARAVAQVVLNRVRHPAYPKSVCGVVFQGSARNTGCQFTFTCDGSLSRPPAAAAWRRAEEIAGDALAGTVSQEVGRATHYHTVWVTPYWSSTLAKVAQIGAHIFYRWNGVPVQMAVRPPKETSPAAVAAAPTEAVLVAGATAASASAPSGPSLVEAPQPVRTPSPTLQIEEARRPEVVEQRAPEKREWFGAAAAPREPRLPVIRE